MSSEKLIEQKSSSDLENATELVHKPVVLEGHSLQPFEINKKIDSDLLELEEIPDEAEAHTIIYYLHEAPSAELRESIRRGLEALEQSLGRDIMKSIMGEERLKVVVGDGLVRGSGASFSRYRFGGRGRMVGLDRIKCEMSPEEDELRLVEAGFYNPGDLDDVTYMGKAAHVVVHEVGHIFDKIVHGHSGGGDTTVFDCVSAPTKYGTSRAMEDYAESFMFYVLASDSLRLSENRRAAIQSDTELVRRQTQQQSSQLAA